MPLSATEAIIVTRSEPHAHWRAGQLGMRDIEVIEAGKAVQTTLTQLSGPVQLPFRRPDEYLVLDTTEYIPIGTRLHIRHAEIPDQPSTFSIIRREMP